MRIARDLECPFRGRRLADLQLGKKLDLPVEFIRKMQACWFFGHDGDVTSLLALFGNP